MHENANANCVICGAEMYGAQCKLICPNCGYSEDCSDLFPLGPGDRSSGGSRERDMTSPTPKPRNGRSS